jgi:hypothetical protein
VELSSGVQDQIFFSVLQLRVSCCGAPFLTIGMVCNLLIQLLLGLARAIQVPQNSDHILLSHLRLSQSGGPGPRIYIPQEQGGPVITPGTGFPFHRLLRLAGQRLVKVKVKVTLRPTVSRPVRLGVNRPSGNP